MKVETVKIKDGNGYIVINKSDLDKQELYREKAKPKKKAK